MRVLLLSTYESGHQPFGLASPAAWLRARGHPVACADLAITSLPVAEALEADLIAFHLPMHTATRLAAGIIPRIRALNPSARICAFGLYAPLNAGYLKSLGVTDILGGEFEAGLAALAGGEPPVSDVSLDRLSFVTPDRSTLPDLALYPELVHGREKRVAGYTEASRGCKHLCRHCPVVPVYNGVFRVVQAGVVLEDIRRQVAAGAAHITFGDPDFFNGPSHARRILEALHSEHPGLTYDVTIKIEHLLQQRDLLLVLRETGCLFVVSAVESVDDAVLARLDKGHTRRDFIEAARLVRENGLTLAPTFIPFTPWSTVAGYRELLDCVAELDLVENVAPVQLSLRLLIPAGSRLLDLEEIRAVAHGFDQKALVYRWKHPDPGVDALASAVLAAVHEGTRQNCSRIEIFGEIWKITNGCPLPENFNPTSRTTIPYLEEPWFC